LDEQAAIDATATAHFAALRERVLHTFVRAPDPALPLSVVRSREHSAPGPAPLVSFVVTVFNKADHIGATLRSIAACSYPNKEIIVVDDCSTDASPERVRAITSGGDALKILRHDCNRGLSVARNTGLAAATGKYIQYWDGDDIYAPDGLTAVVSEMEEDS